MLTTIGLELAGFVILQMKLKEYIVCIARVCVPMQRFESIK